MKIISRMLAVAGLCVMLFSCSTTKKMGATAMNGEWNVVNIKGEAITPSSETPFIGFDMSDNRIYGFTGCNRMTGTLSPEEVKNGTIDFGRIACTRMACPDSKYENMFLGVLGEIKKIKNDGKNIRLCDDSGNTIITLEKRLTNKK